MYFEEVRIGQSLPPLERIITLPMMVAYAGATWDWHRYHYDQAVAKAMGQPAPFVDGQMFGGLLAKLVLDWAGPDAMLRKLRLRYRGMVYAGERVICQGQVSRIEERDGRSLVVCELRIEAGDGRTGVDSASAEVELPRSPAVQ
ncbi:MAG: hypothetical protein HYZ81_19360 [Nitrospinae bacterium]|nr:hypothetical protein [Nitrospinota bacterium]